MGMSNPNAAHSVYTPRKNASSEAISEECEWCGCSVPRKWLVEIEQVNHLAASVCPACARDEYEAAEREREARWDCSSFDEFRANQGCPFA